MRRNNEDSINKFLFSKFLYSNIYYINSVECVKRRKMMYQFIEPTQGEVLASIASHDFFRRMTPMDIIARGAQSPEEYRQRYMRSIRSFSESEREKIRGDLRAIHPLEPKGMRGISWYLVMVPDTVEGGLCHTMGKYVVLTEDFMGKSAEERRYILLHEKVHLFQKIFPEETEQWIREFLRMRPFRGTLPKGILRRRRNNPDLNGWMYQTPQQEVIVELYPEGRQPGSVRDSEPMVVSGTGVRRATHADVGGLPSCANQLEHPYEMMASYIGRLLNEQCWEVDAETKKLHLQVFSQNPHLL